MKIFLLVLIALIALWGINRLIQYTRYKTLPYLHEQPHSEHYAVKQIYTGWLNDIFHNAENQTAILSVSETYHGAEEFIKVNYDGTVLAHLDSTTANGCTLHNGIFFNDNGYIDWAHTNDTALQTFQKIFNERQELSGAAWDKIFLDLYSHADEVRFAMYISRERGEIRNGCLFRKNEKWSILWEETGSYKIIASLRGNIEKPSCCIIKNEIYYEKNTEKPYTSEFNQTWESDNSGIAYQTNNSRKNTIKNTGFYRLKSKFKAPSFAHNPTGYTSGSYHVISAFYKLKYGEEIIRFKEYATIVGAFSFSPSPSIKLYAQHNNNEPFIFWLEDLNFNQSYKAHGAEYDGDRPRQYRGLYVVYRK